MRLPAVKAPRFLRSAYPVPFAALPLSAYIRGVRHRLPDTDRWLFIQECGWDPWIKAKYAKGFKP